MSKPIWFDLETGGFDPTGDRASSLLSVSYKLGDLERTHYSQPEYRSWVSEFSRQEILPQLQNKQTIPEKESIQNFINLLRENPESPLIGFNSEHFDIPFIADRAARHGLGSQFSSAMGGRATHDVALRAKIAMGEGLTGLAKQGVFSEYLEGKTWDQAVSAWGKKGDPSSAPASFKTLAGIESWQRGVASSAGAFNYEQQVKKQFAGWKLADTFDLYQSWKGQTFDIGGSAHESMADVRMTQILGQAEKRGELGAMFKDPRIGKMWLEKTTENIAANSGVDRSLGSYWIGQQKVSPKVEMGGRGSNPLLDKPKQLLNKIPTKVRTPLKVGAGIIGTAALAGGIYSLFSGSSNEEKKQRQAEMQRQATQQLFNNVTAGRNSRM